MKLGEKTFWNAARIKRLTPFKHDLPLGMKVHILVKRAKTGSVAHISKVYLIAVQRLFGRTCFLTYSSFLSHSDLPRVLGDFLVFALVASSFSVDDIQSVGK